MKNTFWNKKIPTLLGIIFIIVGIAVTTFLVKQGGLFSIKAGPSEVPKNVRITNITDTSFTVSYFTDGETNGILNYGNSPSIGQSALDDRDQQIGNIINHKSHNITVRNLQPQTKYYFSIISGKDSYMNNSVPFEVITGQVINTNPLQQNPLAGKIIIPGGTPPTEALAYLTVNNAQVISTLIKSDGTLILPLNSIRTSDFSAYYKIEENQILKLLVIGDNMTSNITLSLNQISPVPTITLSNDYDFVTAKSPIASSSGNLESFPAFESNNSPANNTQELKISTPVKNQEFTDQQPEFKGKATPNETIEIVVNSDSAIQATVKADKNGNWTFRPSTELSAGNHTITITAKDTNGILKTITQSFVVYASGTQIAGANGSPTPSPKPSLTLTPTLAPTATPILTSVPSPTSPITPIISPTTFPSETKGGISVLTPAPPLPPTGNPIIITTGIVSLFIALTGGFLLLLSRGGFI